MPINPDEVQWDTGPQTARSAVNPSEVKWDDETELPSLAPGHVTVPTELVPSHEPAPSPQDLYAAQEVLAGTPKKEIQAELGGLKEPWMQPIDAAAAGFGGGALIGYKAGGKLLSSLTRGLVASIPAAAMEYPIGHTAELLMEENPELAFLFAIGVGLASGLTIENLAERGMLKVARNLTSKHIANPKIKALADKLGVQTPKEKAREAFDRGMPDTTPDETDFIQTEYSLTGSPTKRPKEFGPGSKAFDIPEIKIEEVVWDKTPKIQTEQLIPDPGSNESLFFDGRKWRTIPKEGDLPKVKPVTKKPIKTASKPKPGRILTELERDGLAGMKRDLESGQGPLTKFTEPGPGEGGWTPETIKRLPSTNPDWFKDMIARKVVRDKKHVYRVIDNALTGKRQTAAQGRLLDDILDSLDKNWEKHLSPAELKIKRQHGWEGLEKHLSEGEGVTLYLHPSTVTGPIGGLAAGVDWEEYKQTGTIKIDVKKALVGAMVGVAGGASIRPTTKLAQSITKEWDAKFAEPFINLIKEKVNGLIVHEDIRHLLGMGRSKVFQDAMRNFKRDTEAALNEAVRIGHELFEIAPTQVEQRWVMQLIRGGISANPTKMEKARKVQKLFAELRGQLKEQELLEYSRFDKLTRKERAELRRKISGPNPFEMDNPKALHEYAKWFDLDYKEILKRRGNLKDLQMEIQHQIDFHRSRLHDHYHFGSAREYAPVYFNEYEGLTPTQKKVLEDEIQHLKVKSRRGTPEGQQDLEDMIARMEALLGKGKEARRALRAERQALNLSYSHRRNDMPVELQKLLGLIDEAPFPVAKMAAVQKTDVLKSRLFQYIADDPTWVFRASRKMPDAPANFVKVNDERFGALNGLYVRRDIWDDLKEIEEWRGYVVRNWDRLLGMWKYGKVILNPATHARNTMSNIILAYLGDVNPTDLKTYTKAGEALKNGEANKFYKEAQEWGLFNDTFVSAEIAKFRDELEELRDPKSVKNWIRKVAGLPAGLYQGNERFFKLAVFIKAREGGASVDAAARKAEKFIFNYADIPPWVKHTKRWLSPFFTFTYKAIPLFGEMAIRKPWKVAAIMASMYGMEEFAKRQLGMTQEEAEKERALLPEWQRQKAPPLIGPYTHVLMPFQDKWGNNLYLDMAYILPYGNIAEKWGQSAIPLADLMPSNPALQYMAAILTNRKPFTGQPVYDEMLDTGLQVAGKYLELAWKEAAPSLAPGGYGFNKLKTGFMNTFMGKDVRDWADRPVQMETALASTLFGIKLSPANSQKIEREYQRKKITRGEYQEQVRELLELKKKLLEERPKP